MKPISVEDYIKLRVAYQPSLNTEQLKFNIQKAIRDKLEGYSCKRCGGEIWAVGVVVVEDHLCYDCILSGENKENDIEFDVVLKEVY